MKKFKTADLKKLLSDTNKSPEELSKSIPISNMTIRRWLKKKDTFVLPEKYQIFFNSPEGSEFSVSDQVISKISNIDDQLLKDGKGVEVDQEFLKSVLRYLKRFGSKNVIFQNAMTLLKIIKSNNNHKAQLIALGALVYLLNPIDLIPDTLGPIGYIDDIGVMTYAIAKISELQKLTL